MYLCDVLTLGADLAGLPGLSLPAQSADGLPVGLQLIGAPWSEGDLLRLARGYEGITAGAPWRSLEPADLPRAQDPATPTPAERAASLAPVH
jgi:Asp-tRNA(Asn)/Glu-tRNA(Gln) amidotransferase A subunit family amidase